MIGQLRSDGGVGSNNPAKSRRGKYVDSMREITPPLTEGLRYTSARETGFPAGRTAQALDTGGTTMIR